LLRKGLFEGKLWNIYMWVPKSWGYPNSWVVDFMENPIKVDDLVVPSILRDFHLQETIDFS
jgi:hypothetical protein